MSLPLKTKLTRDFSRFVKRAKISAHWRKEFYFISCASQGDEKALAKVLDAYPEAVHWKPDDYGSWTGLIAAAHNGRQECVDLLLRHGADVNATDRYGDTPLSWAAHWRHADAIRSLILAGADLDSKNVKGVTPRMTIESSGPDDVIRLGMLKALAEREQKTIDSLTEGTSGAISIKAPLKLKRGKSKITY